MRQSCCVLVLMWPRVPHSSATAQGQSAAGWKARQLCFLLQLITGKPPVYNWKTFPVCRFLCHSVYTDHAYSFVTQRQHKRGDLVNASG